MEFSSFGWIRHIRPRSERGLSEFVDQFVAGSVSDEEGHVFQIRTPDKSGMDVTDPHTSIGRRMRFNLLDSGDTLWRTHRGDVCAE